MLVAENEHTETMWAATEKIVWTAAMLVAENEHTETMWAATEKNSMNSSHVGC